MDVFTQKRITSWAIALLVMLNVATLAIVWLTRKPASPPPPPSGRDTEQVKDFLKKELDLSAEQVARYEALHAQHKARSRVLEDEIHEYRRQMMDQLASPQPDLNLVDRLAGEIGTRQAELDKATFLHILDIKAMCTPTQQARLTEIFREVLRAIRPPGRPGPPRRDPGRPPGEPPPPPGDDQSAGPPPPREEPPDRQPPPDPESVRRPRPPEHQRPEGPLQDRRPPRQPHD